MSGVNVLSTFIVIGLLWLLAIYIVLAIFLNKFNELVYGKKTVMAWIPIANIYLLGKLSINKISGWILVILLFVSDAYSILPANLVVIIGFLYYSSLMCLIAYAFVKYSDLKKAKKKNESTEQKIETNEHN